MSFYLQVIMEGMLHKNRCLQPNFRVLKESDEGKLFQWAELQVVCCTVIFSLKEEIARVRDIQIFISSG